jgi:hypothetical protein
MEEADLHSWLSLGLVLSAIGVSIAEHLGVKAPYGKFVIKPAADANEPPRGCLARLTGTAIPRPMFRLVRFNAQCFVISMVHQSSFGLECDGIAVQYLGGAWYTSLSLLFFSRLDISRPILCCRFVGAWLEGKLLLHCQSSAFGYVHGSLHQSRVHLSVSPECRHCPGAGVHCLQCIISPLSPLLPQCSVS